MEFHHKQLKNYDKNLQLLNVENYFEPAPFNFDDKAIKELEKCDYNIKITAKIAFSGKAPRKVRVYTDGIYDLFHAGHARQFLQAKNLFPNVYLIIGACNDEIASNLKGRTVLNEKERYESLRHCRYVDEIIIDAPLVLTENFIEKHKIDFVAQDPAPYPFEGFQDVYALVKEKNMFLETTRTEGVSTTEIISRVIRDYDKFVVRNLKKGCTPEELNIKYFKHNKAEISSEEENGEIESKINYQPK